MQSATQILAHRAQSAARTKSRWQPYNPLPMTSTSVSSAILNTQKPSIQPSHPPPTVTPSCTKNQQSSATPISSAQSPKESIQRDGSKQKFALGLIDQAVKSLSDIWCPRDIPSVFLGPSKATPSTASTPSTSTAPPAQVLVSTGNDSDGAMVPLKNFVHEVLKRSRTSGSILQAALCYLEAVRPKITEIRRDDKLGIKSYFLPDTAIQPATEAEIQLDKELSESEANQPITATDDLLGTIRVMDHCPEDSEFDSDSWSITGEPAPSTIFSTAATLPSPLLCPRRTFLAALILASKFSQDKCYSNRAWAKLSGLPAREIGRCERALGQALDWRLWVGKSPAAPQALSVRTVVRSQSESSIASPSSSRAPFLCPAEAQASCAGTEGPSLAPIEVLSTSSGSFGRGIRKCSTLPAEAFCQLPASSVADLSCDSISEKMDIVIDERRPSSKPSSSFFAEPRPISYASSESGCSNSSNSDAGSSPVTPPLSDSPSTSGDRTIQVSSFEEGGFPSYNASQSWLDIWDTRQGPIRTASPASFSVDSKASGSAASMYISQLAFDMAQMQAKLAVADPEPGTFGPLAGLGGPYLWHADGGYAPTSVY